MEGWGLRGWENLTFLCWEMVLEDVSRYGGVVVSCVKSTLR